MFGRMERRRNGFTCAPLWAIISLQVSPGWILKEVFGAGPSRLNAAPSEVRLKVFEDAMIKVKII